jgi:hypothetical protein
VSGTRLFLPVLAAVVAAAPAHAQLFPRKPKLDAPRVKQLTDVLRADPDERKRRAAVAELRDADPRQLPEVVPALVWALQRDPSAVVRAEAAEAIGHIKLMVPLAGAALESAAESDPSPAVRDAARQALWEYHLIGYRSTKGSDGIAGQTVEPPIAKPAAPRPPVANGPAPQPPVPPNPPIVPVSVKPQPVALVKPQPVAVGPPQPVPPPTTQFKGGIRTLVTAVPPPQLNVTDEPPLATPPLSRTPPELPVAEVGLPSVTLPPDEYFGPPPSPTQLWTPPRVLPIPVRPSLPIR